MHQVFVNSRPSIPVVARYAAQIDAKDRERVSTLAQRLLKGEPSLSDTSHFGAPVASGLWSDGPALLVADQSEIALYGPPDEQPLEYRIACLALPGDMLVLSHGRSKAFERYQKDYLGIGGLDVLIAGGRGAQARWGLPRRCLQDPNLFEHITRSARTAGSLNLLPYLSTGHLWHLAGAVAETSGAKVAVAAPPPRLARRVNDKIWFANRIEQLFGRVALSPATVVYGPSALAGHVARLSGIAERIIVKIPDSAGSSGNLTAAAAQFRGRKLSWIRRRLVQMLYAMGWQGTFPLKIEIWETPSLCSPSLQTWIPDRRHGWPVVEGLFEQVVDGAHGQFIGAVNCVLPDPLQEKLIAQGLVIARLFQELGYFGRCSLDALIAGSSYDDAQLHWIECNGRWGGVSLPMTLANRLQPDGNPQLMVVMKRQPDLQPRSFADVLDLLADLLFERGNTREGIVVLTPAGLEEGLNVHFMAIAQSLESVREMSREALRRLVGTGRA